jgi:SNF2 family DNA or RNA helicase
VLWDTVIVDEAHRLKNKESKTFLSLQGFKAIPPVSSSSIEPAHCVLMTGTPLQNNTEELWCLLHFLAPNQFADLEAFISTYGNPPTPSQVYALRKCLKPYMLRREKEEVEKTMPPKTEIIVEVEMSQLQRTTYKSILTKNFEWLSKGGSKDAQASSQKSAYSRSLLPLKWVSFDTCLLCAACVTQRGDGVAKMLQSPLPHRWCKGRSAEAFRGSELAARSCVPLRQNGVAG